MPAQRKGVGLIPGTKSQEIGFRATITLLFVIGYMLFIVSSIVLWALSMFFPLRGTVADLKDLILTISGVFSGPLGIMIGYYFRGEIERKVA